MRVHIGEKKLDLVCEMMAEHANMARGGGGVEISSVLLA